MSVITENRRSFVGGEWSPLTDSRNDLEKYPTACPEITNFKPTPYGGAFSRPGTEFIKEQKFSNSICRLVGFEFSANVSVVAEFGQNYIRFFSASTLALVQANPSESWSSGTAYVRGDWVSNGGLPYYVLANHTSAASIATDISAGRIVQQNDFEIYTPFSSSEVNGLQFAQDNRAIYITHPNHRPKILRRNSSTRWTFREFLEEWPAVLPQNLSSTEVTLFGPVMLASGSIFVPEHVGSRWLVEFRREDPSVSIDLVTAANGDITDGLYVLGEWSASIKADSTGSGAYNSRIVVQRSRKGHSTGPWETIRTISSNRASIQQIIAGTELEPCWLRIKVVEKNGTQPPGLNAEIVASDPSHYTVVEITGYGAANSVSVDVLIEAPVSTATPYWSEASWSDANGWPRSTTLFDNRLFFGGTVAQPQTVWGSIVDDYQNFRLGSDDDMAVQFKAASNTGHTIQWMTSREALVVGTTGSEWIYGSGEGGSVITPTSTKARLSTAYGSAHIQPKVSQDAILFVQATLRKIREFAYSYESDGFKAQDMNLLAEHITSGGIRNISLQQNPDTILWVVLTNGQLLGLNYDRTQSIAGWFRYRTQGFFESVCAVLASSASEEDHVWVSVRRTINGSTKRFIERFRPNQTAELKSGEERNLVCADSARVYSGPNITEIPDLQHLAGMNVKVVADGQVRPDAVVSDLGFITISPAASVIVTGLSYTCTLEPTWLETPDPDANGKAMMKRLSRCKFQLWKTNGCEFKGNGEGSKFQRLDFGVNTDPMDLSIPLFTGIKGADIISNSVDQSSIIIRQTIPRPLNILSLLIDYDISQAP